nr:pilus assembly protein TadG-related protein [Streptomyces sp. LX-29]
MTDGLARRLRGDAGQAFPLYLTAVVGLLFLALAFFAVGQAGATRNGGQTAADAAALAAAQSYRGQLRVALLDAIARDTPWDDILDGRFGVPEDPCADAEWFAGKNDARLRACDPGYLPVSFAVTVETLHTVGKSVIPGTENKRATARAKAVVEPRCVHEPPETPPEPEPSGGEDDQDEDNPEGKDKDKDKGEDRRKGEDEPAEEKPPIHLVCDGAEVDIDPERLDDFPEAKALYAVKLAP